MLCESNVNIKVAQKLLGHSDIETTMNIYTDVSEEFQMKEFFDKVKEL
ncbi:tyrosine-type recombinase/integrase [Oribacterium sp. P6A1]